MSQRMVLALLVSLACSAHARGQAQQPQQQPAPAASDNYVTDKGFRSRVFEVKHRDPRGLASVLGPLGSGFKGATVRNNDEFRTITVRDFPENIAVMEEALKRLDTPEAPRANIELRIHVLMASTGPGATSADVPADLQEVLRQLQTTLNFKSYYLAASIVQRTKEGADNVQGGGVIDTKLYDDVSRNMSTYEYGINDISVSNTEAGAPVVQMRRFRFRMPGLADIMTTTDVREGERVVVGTASLRDKALIIVLSARTLK